MLNGPNGGVFDPVRMFRRLVLDNTNPQLDNFRLTINENVFSPTVPESLPIHPCLSYSIIAGQQDMYIPLSNAIVMTRVWVDETQEHDRTRELSLELQRAINNRNNIEPTIFGDDSTEKVTNSTFDTDTTGWTVVGGGSVSGGVLSWSGAIVASVRQDITLQRGRVYRLALRHRLGVGSGAQNATYQLQVTDQDRSVLIFDSEQDSQLGKGSGYNDLLLDFTVPVGGYGPDDDATVRVFFQVGDLATIDFDIDSFSVTECPGQIYSVTMAQEAGDFIDPDTEWRYTQAMWNMQFFTGYNPEVVNPV